MIAIGVPEQADDKNQATPDWRAGKLTGIDRIDRMKRESMKA
jgi:hypothetical protein